MNFPDWKKWKEAVQKWLGDRISTRTIVLVASIAIPLLWVAMLWLLRGSQAMWSTYGRLCVLSGLAGGIIAFFVASQFIDKKQKHRAGLASLALFAVVLPLIFLVTAKEDSQPKISGGQKADPLPTASGEEETAAAAVTSEPLATPSQLLEVVGQEALAQGWRLLPMIQQPQSAPYQVKYNTKDGVVLTDLDVSLCEDAILEAKRLDSSRQDVVQYAWSAEKKAIPLFLQGRPRHVHLQAEDHSVYLVPPIREAKGSDCHVEFVVRPPAERNAAWVKTKKVVDLRSGAEEIVDLSPLQQPGPFVRWGEVSLQPVEGCQALQAFSVFAQCLDPATGQSLDTAEALSLPTEMAPTVLLVGENGDIQPFPLHSQSFVRITSDKLPDKKYTLYIRSLADKPLLWRVSVRCDIE